MTFIINPFYWPLWLLVGCIRLIICLPYPWLMRLGQCIGKVIGWFPSAHRTIAEINIKLCFPELNEKQRRQLLRKNYESVGMALFETFLAWWAPDAKLQSLLHVVNPEVYEQACAQGRGVILPVPHLLTLEIVGRLIAKPFDMAALYRPHRQAFIEQFNERHRQQHFVGAIARDNLRGMVRALKAGMKVFFLPDIDAGHKHSVFVNFFGVEAATVAGTSRLAKMSGALVLPLTYYRRADLSGYDLHFYPVLENFPTDDVAHDIQRVNDIFEEMIRQHPEQYLWQYRRFRTRSDTSKVPRRYPSSRRTK